MVAKLKANILTLEGQVGSLKADLTEVRRSLSLSSGSRDSLSACDHNPEPPQTSDGPDKSHDPRLSFSYVYKRNKTRDWVPVVSLENGASDEVSRGTDVQEDSTAQTAIRSPERHSYRSCSIATNKVMPEKHCVHVRARTGVSVDSSGEFTATCNGDAVAEAADRLSSDVDVFNDTLSDLVESNSDTSGRVLGVNVSTTIRCRNHGEASTTETWKLCNGSASALETLTRSGVDCSTQTSSDERISDRCVVTNELVMFYLCFNTLT